MKRFKNILYDVGIERIFAHDALKAFPVVLLLASQFATEISAANL